MNTSLAFRRLFLAPLLCCCIAAAPALAADSAAKPAAKPAAKTAQAAKKPVAKAPAKAAKKGENQAEVQSKLDTFARNLIVNLNTYCIPSEKKKNVVKNSDGSYTASYKAIDPQSLLTSFRTPESSKAITYVGDINYHEVDYTCTAKTEAAALKGPFVEAERMPIRELVKYKKGKWSY